ncbi:ATP-binding protein [Sedimenticola sp.]|uniref:ATP-binding protein n=1 Tax=Sedimenticola sp. TaxID=1940285 RepID=UPI003D13A143
MTIERRNSLSYKQAMITVMTVFIIGLFISLYQIAADLKQEKQHVDQTVNQVLSLLRSPAAQAAYSLDNNLAQQVVNGLFEYPPVIQAEIRDDLGGLLASAERPHVDMRLRRLADLLVGSSKTYHLPLSWDGREQPVGMVIVSIDPYLVTEGFFDRAGRILLFGVVRNLILALLLSMIFYYTLTKPMMETAASFAAINPGAARSKKLGIPKGHHKDEIGLLIDKANRMLGEFELHIQQQEEAEAELNRLRNLLSNVVDSMPSSLICVDVDCHVIQWNRQAEIIAGVSAARAVGQDLVTAFPLLQQEVEHVKDAIRNGISSHDQRLKSAGEESVRLYDVTIYPLTTNGIDGAVIRVDDVTERVRIEEMMIQSEKMLSIGGLAAGMAHEINNPLAGILQNIQVMQNRIQGDLPVNIKTAEACGTNIESVTQYLSERKVYEMIERIRESGKRAAKIVDNMLSFSRKSRRHLQPCNVEELLEQTLDLAANDFRLEDGLDFRQIAIVREYDQGLPTIECEPSQIQQVLLNLLKNGAQAMGQQREPGYQPCFTLRAQAEPDWIRIEIEDNGPGIPDDQVTRIFEPFYTTKPIGIGTGLGLSVSYFIIKENYGGELRVEKAPTGGARFVLRLPYTQDELKG